MKSERLLKVAATSAVGTVSITFLAIQPLGTVKVGVLQDIKNLFATIVCVLSISYDAWH